MTAETYRSLSETKKHIENYMHISYEKYYTSFNDFLIPLHFSLLLIKMNLESILKKHKQVS